MRYALCMLFCLSGWAGAEPGLTIMTDDRHPLAWQEGGKGRGIAYDLVVATMKELGADYPIEFTSFGRGLKLAQTKDNVAFFSVTRSPERLNTLKWVGPLVRNDVYVYKLKNAPFTVEKFADLRGLKGIGVPKGMSQDTYLTQQGFGNVMRSDNLPNALRALALKRVDVVAMGQMTVGPSAREAGLNPAELEQTPLQLYENPLYLAFSRNVGDETVARWQKALDKVKREKYKQLQQQYLR